jgi:gas vesicle protein
MFKENKTALSLSNNIFGVATGLFLGSMIGAATMFFLAPQSGKRSRAQIQQKGIELRDRTNEIVEDTVAQVRKESKKLTKTGRQKARQLMAHGQELVTEQLGRVPDVVKAGKKAILGS